MTLEGRRIAVAGAGGSLGPHVARALAAAGAELWLTDRDEEKLRAIAEEVDAHDARVVDLLDLKATQDWAAAGGYMHGVAHLVGGWKGGTPLSEAPLEDWDLLHDLLIRTVQHTTIAFAPAIKRARERGRFVLVSSKQAQAPTATNAAYAAAKAAAEAWTLAFADELKESSGGANVLVVNAIVTPEMRAENPDKAFATFTAAEQMASTIAWMLSEEAVAMNGQRVSLHG
ncbi:MAG TPA: SDR family NAD(P)-dependent oxidoreductase [Solirubrobacteraceae bacterium]|jgi:NAD(P)-dependent dehydrogenase (short-subunit alcohol dehydrogenase family)